MFIGWFIGLNSDLNGIHRALWFYGGTPTNLLNFIQNTAVYAAGICEFHIKDVNNTLTLGNGWVRGYVQYQNPYSSGYDVDGYGLMSFHSGDDGIYGFKIHITNGTPSIQKWALNDIPNYTARTFSATTHFNATTMRDLKYGKIHILTFSVYPKAGLTPVGYEQVGTLGYSIIGSSSSAIALSTYQDAGQCMGQITVDGRIQFAGMNASASNDLEWRGTTVVIET